MNPLSIGKSIFVCLIKIINYLGYEKNDIQGAEAALAQMDICSKKVVADLISLKNQTDK